MTTTQISNKNLCSSLEPFVWVGHKTAIRSQYARGTVPLAHAVYDQMLRILENRQIIDTESGRTVKQILLPGVKGALRRAGWTEMEIAQEEMIIIDTLADHPKWTVERDAPLALASILKRYGRLNLLDERRIVPIPGLALNALLGEQLLSLFTLSDLLAVPGFVSRGSESTEGNAVATVRVDIDPIYARAGFLIPIVSNRLIVGMRVFRYPSDRRPFLLKSRKREVHLNA